MQRSTIAIVFGILNLVFAGVGVVGLLFSAWMLQMSRDMAAPNPVLQIINENPAYATFYRVSVALGFVASIVLAVAGIGLLAMKPWGRYLSIGYALYAIAMAIVGMAANYFFLLMPMMDKLAATPAGPQQAGLIGGVVGGTCGGCFGLIYPVVMLCFMFRPSLIAALRSRTAASEFDFTRKF